MKKGLKRLAATLLAGALTVGAAFAAPVTGFTRYAEEGTVKEAEAAVPYNYAKLLQQSLYFYDANMCGTDVTNASLHSWRNNCHTFDKTTYRRSDGSTVTVDLTGGYHDAGDHVKFGLPAAYSAFVLGMSYDTNKDAYQTASQTGHLQKITTRFADYFVKCTVLNSAGTKVEAFCVQVGQGGAGYDHGYWGAPENQSNANRPFYFSGANDPSTDIVSLSVAALAMQYKNFGGQKYLDTAKKLFAYARDNQKATNHSAGSFYNSSSWADDYCLAATILYKVTNDSQYLNEYNRYSSQALYVGWPLSWDDTKAAVAFYNGKSDQLSPNKIGGSTVDGVYKCINDWGSCRYNTSMQYMALMYDKLTGTNTYRGWAEQQMNYILGSNPRNQCYVCGFASNSSKYPHHRAASGYTGGTKGTTAQAHVLTGALVGGPGMGGNYQDTADNYQFNEVALDYNATLVAAAAAIYSGHKGEATVDGSLYMDGPVTVYNGVDYAPVYNFEYYMNKYPDLKKAFGNDSQRALQHFVNNGMKEGRQAIATFDVNSYKNANVDLRNEFGTDLTKYYLHYVKYGKNEVSRRGTTTGVNAPVGTVTKFNGVNYAAVYNYAYYTSKYPDLKNVYGNDDVRTLQHFVNFGMKEGRQASADFDIIAYAYSHADIRHIYKNDLVKYYMHFINFGKKEGRKATVTRVMKNYAVIYNGVNYADVFDWNYYTHYYPDIKKAYGFDDAAALRHFVVFGMKEGRQAKATFDVKSYKNAYADLRSAYANDYTRYYLHYINAGKSEGRNKTTGITSPIGYVTKLGGVDYSAVYDFEYYLANNKDVRRALGRDDVEVLKQFVNYGMKEGRRASAEFDVNYYKNSNKDLRKAYGNDLARYYLHYIKAGKKEGRRGSAQ
ncbi:MAG: glycoside hydrolase family 9 protein [Eubacterium sp.]|nr:glycoside hydrolase family 9 protein [Eubacterium sp.]